MMDKDTDPSEKGHLDGSGVPKRKAKYRADRRAVPATRNRCQGIYAQRLGRWMGHILTGLDQILARRWPDTSFHDGMNRLAARLQGKAENFVEWSDKRKETAREKQEEVSRGWEQSLDRLRPAKEYPPEQRSHLKETPPPSPPATPELEDERRRYAATSIVPEVEDEPGASILEPALEKVEEPEAAPVSTNLSGQRKQWSGDRSAGEGGKGVGRLMLVGVLLIAVLVGALIVLLNLPEEGGDTVETPAAEPVAETGPAATEAAKAPIPPVAVPVEGPETGPLGQAEVNQIIAALTAHIEKDLEFREEVRDPLIAAVQTLAWLGESRPDFQIGPAIIRLADADPAPAIDRLGQMIGLYGIELHPDLGYQIPNHLSGAERAGAATLLLHLAGLQSLTDIRAAERAIDGAVRLGSDDPAIQYHVGNWHKRHDRRSAAHASYRQVMEIADDHDLPYWRARAVGKAGELQFDAGLLQPADRLFRNAVAGLGAAGRPTEQARYVLKQAHLHLIQRREVYAEETLRQALALSPGLKAERFVRDLVRQITENYLRERRYDLGLDMAVLGLALDRTAGAGKHGSAGIWVLIGRLQHQMHRPEQAAAAWEEAVQLVEREGNVAEEMKLRRALARFYLSREAPWMARKVLRPLMVRDDLAGNDSRQLVDGLLDLAQIEQQLGQSAPAREVLETALMQEKAASPSRAVLGKIHHQLGRAFQKLGDVAAAEQAYRTAGDHYRHTGERYLGEVARITADLAALYQIHGNNRLAEHAREDAFAAFRELGDVSGQVAQMAGLGTLYISTGRQAMGCDRLRRARELSSADETTGPGAILIGMWRTYCPAEGVLISVD